MATTLEDLVAAYLADSQGQEEKQRRTEVRNLALPQVSAIARSFAAGNIDLKTFCEQLLGSFKTTGERWGAQGNSFTLPLYRMAKTHDEREPIAEPKLRQLITDINASNMGERIEQFSQFLLAERARLRQENKHGVEVGRSALIISFFAFWLHPEQEPIIYHGGVREGLYLLIKKKLLTPAPGLNMDGDTIVNVLTNADHQAFIATLNALLKEYPQLRNSPYWAEYFFYWLYYYFGKQTQPASPPPTLTREQNESGVLADDPGLVREKLADYGANENELQNAAAIDEAPLVPTPEPLLTRLIQEVQRHILIDEVVVRRIYHALLAGHVILSGPPGTGKTELARLIPEILWKSPEGGSESDVLEDAPLTSKTAYTTRLVTATDEWSVRTLISGIAPVSNNGHISYKVQYGHLTSAILKNWTSQSDNPDDWGSLTLRRSLVTSNSGIERGTPQTFRGQWLVIDEFNRAPIDLALGDALTALGGNDVLRVAIEGGSAELPIPKDFRVIGTLNSFDRNYLNQISEALKRRFSFVEILPPGRSLREAEKAIVLYKALERTSHLSKSISVENNVITWGSTTVEAEPEGYYVITWPDNTDDNPGGFYVAFETAWCLFDIIRIYRQLGTAQAISLVRHMLIAGLLQGYTTREEWIATLDAALCDTIADQLQVLLPDEIDALLLTLTHTHNRFREAYNRLLTSLVDRPQRLYGHLLALSRVNDEFGGPYLTDEEAEVIAQSNQPAVAPEKLDDLFHLLYFNKPALQLPLFTRRLRAFKAERGL